MKNIKALRTVRILPIIQLAKRAILLTGTPAFARPIELFPLLSSIRPDIYKDVKQFGDRYCNPTYNMHSRQMEYSGNDNL